MDPRDIMDVLRPDKFRPCVFVTDRGERHEVRQRRSALVVSDGTVHVYKPSERIEGAAERSVRIPFERIVAIEPLQPQNA